MENISKEQKRGTFAKVTLSTILISTFVRSIGASIVDIGLPNFIISLSGTLASFGLIVGMFSITQSIFQFPMAAASDKFGRKNIILLGIFVYTLGTFLCYLAQNVVQLIIFRAIQGAGAYSSILQAIVGDSFNKEEHGKGMSYYSLSFTFGYFGGISIGGYISFYLGFRSVFFFAGVLAALSGILIFIFFKDIKCDKARKYKNSEKINRMDPLNSSTIRTLLKNPQYDVAVLINCMRWLVFGGIVAYVVWVMEIQFYLNQIEASYILIVIVAAYLSFELITGKLVDRFGCKRLVIIGQAIIVGSSALFFIISVTNDLFLFIIASLFSGIGLGMFETSGNTNILKKIEQIDPKLKGTGFGINNAIGFFCGAIGPIILSLMGEIWVFLPYYFIFFYMAICFLISLKFIKV